MVIVLLTLFLDSLGIGLVLPVLPRLVLSLTGDDTASATRSFGLFVAVYAAMQFLFAPLLGGLSDRYGRRGVLLLSLLGSSLDYLLLALAPNLSWLFLGRTLAGLTGASFSTAAAYLTDVTPIEKRSQNFGLIGAAFGLGLVFGPALGGLLGSLHLRAPFALASLLNILNFSFGLIALPESLPIDNRRPFSLTRSNPFASIYRVLRDPRTLRFVLVLLCWYLAQQILQNTWALYGQYRFQWTERQVGASLTIAGVLGALAQGGVLQWMLRVLGERRSLLLGFALSTVGMSCFGLATQSWMMLASMLPFALGCVAGPTAQSVLSRQVSPSEQGQLQGTLSSLQSASAVLGPLLATQLFAWFQADSAPVRLRGAPWFMAALLHLAALVLVLRAPRFTREATGSAAEPALP